MYKIAKWNSSNIVSHPSGSVSWQSHNFWTYLSPWLSFIHGCVSMPRGWVWAHCGTADLSLTDKDNIMHCTVNNIKNVQAHIVDQINWCNTNHCKWTLNVESCSLLLKLYLVFANFSTISENSEIDFPEVGGDKAFIHFYRHDLWGCELSQTTLNGWMD